MISRNMNHEATHQKTHPPSVTFCHEASRPVLAVGDGWTEGGFEWRIVRGGRISEDHRLGYADLAPGKNTIWMPVSPMWITDSTIK